MLAFFGEGVSRLQGRKLTDATARYPEVVRAVEKARKATERLLGKAKGEKNGAKEAKTLRALAADLINQVELDQDNLDELVEVLLYEGVDVGRVDSENIVTLLLLRSIFDAAERGSAEGPHAGDPAFAGDGDLHGRQRPFADFLLGALEERDARVLEGLLGGHVGRRAERIHTACFEGVPVSDREPQVLFHGLWADNLLSIVILKR